MTVAGAVCKCRDRYVDFVRESRIVVSRSKGGRGIDASATAACMSFLVAIQRELAWAGRSGTDVFHHNSSIHRVGNFGYQVRLALACWCTWVTAVAFERVLDGKLVIAFIGLRHHVAVVK